MAGATTAIKGAFTSAAFLVQINADLAAATLPTLVGSIRKKRRQLRSVTGFPAAYVEFVGPVENRKLDASGMCAHEGRIAFHVVFGRLAESDLFDDGELLVDTVKDAIEDHLKASFHRLQVVSLDPEGQIAAELEYEHRDFSVTARFIYLRQEGTAD